ncbi:hypothetical protein [Marinimicrococcus flavescens]|uniref:Uncharacterized protein n=1 Tax=Marinimicrococcus flavescens TaxID=3031815 RepID=A0AAP3XRI4_9PROT|nr:hypothetical protein [Marinimicrococcus flavescens]
MLNNGEACLPGRQLALEETYDCCRAAGLSHNEALGIARSVIEEIPGSRPDLPERRLVGLAVERAQAMLAKRRGAVSPQLC